MAKTRWNAEAEGVVGLIPEFMADVAWWRRKMEGGEFRHYSLDLSSRNVRDNKIGMYSLGQ